jgi:hypothetical protein
MRFDFLRACRPLLASVGLAVGALAGPAPAGEPTISIPPIPIPAPLPPAPARPAAAPQVVAPAPAPIPAPVPAAPPALAGPAPVMAAPIPVRVYVLNGMDPFGFGGLKDMTERIRSNGYDTHYGQWYQVIQFEREIRAIHDLAPSTQFAIIGYSFGVYRAKALANRLTRDGIPVAMVGYIGGDYLRNSASDVPGGARVVNVTGNGFFVTGRNLFWNGTELSGADNVRLRANHFDLPKQQQALDALLAGLGSGGGTLVVPPQPGQPQFPTAAPGQSPTAAPAPGGVGFAPGRPALSQAGASVAAPYQASYTPNPASLAPPPIRRSTSPAAAASLPYRGARR